MATYMELCNLVLKQLNEVEFIQSTFTSPTGFHAFVKNAINFALRDIAQAEIEWPFALTDGSQVLTPETNIYSFAADYEWADWQSFHLERDDSLDVDAQHLDALTYDEWNIYRRGMDEQNNSGVRLPEYIFKLPDEKWGVTPIPDRAYTITFKYYGFATDLSLYNDAAVVPDRFKRVIFDAAMYYAYMFRDNMEQAQLSKVKYEEGLKYMRTLLINKYERVNDTRVNLASGRFSRLLTGP